MSSARCLLVPTLLAAGVLTLAACGGSDAGTTLPSSRTAPATASATPTTLPTDGDGTVSGLLFTRDDGSTFVMTDVGISCQKSQVDDRTEVVRLASTVNSGEVDATQPFFYAEVVPGTQGEIKLPLPSGTVAHAPAVDLFGYDPMGQNELSGDQKEADGTIDITSAACTPKPELSFEIDGTLGSVYGRAPGRRRRRHAGRTGRLRRALRVGGLFAWLLVATATTYVVFTAWLLSGTCTHALPTSVQGRVCNDGSSSWSYLFLAAVVVSIFVPSLLLVRLWRRIGWWSMIPVLFVTAGLPVLLVLGLDLFPG